MSPKSADLAVIEVDREATRLLVARVRPQAPAARRPAATRSGARNPRASRVRQLDSRVRPLAADDLARAASPEAIAVEALSTVTRYLKIADRAAATPILIARHEIRRSPEGMAILSLLASEIPHPVRLLSPRREQELTLQGLRPLLDSETPELVVVMKPAATELVATAATNPAQSCELPIGAAGVAGALPDPPTPLEWALEAMRLGGMLASLPRPVPLRVYATGEGADALAAFDSIRGEKAPVTLTLADLDRLSDEVVRASTRKIARRTGDDPRRIALLAPAALILAAILTRYGLSRCMLVPYGLREGVAVAAADDPDGWWMEARAGAGAAPFDAVAADG